MELYRKRCGLRDFWEVGLKLICLRPVSLIPLSTLPLSTFLFAHSDTGVSLYQPHEPETDARDTSNLYMTRERDLPHFRLGRWASSVSQGLVKV